LPRSDNYFIKNPTPEQIKEYGKKEKSFTPEEKICKICYTTDSNTIVNNCGHGGMCSDCARDIVKKMGTCPLCRKPIDKV